MNTWLHRISHHAEAAYPLLEKGYLSIGFWDLMNPDTLQIAEEHNWHGFEVAVEDAYGTLLRSRHSLWRFLVEMEDGDWVLVPSWGTFSVFQISGPPQLICEIGVRELRAWNQLPLEVLKDGLHIEDRILDLGFFRTVTPVALDVSRYDYADAALTSRMKMRPTNALITDLQGSVENALASFQKKKPINLHAQILEAQCDDLLARVHESLTPDKLESLIAWYFRRVGATEVTIPPKNERGKLGDADIVAVFEPLKTIFYVQAKFHRNETSDWAVQQVRDYKDKADSMDDGYARVAWVISTGDSFSEECRQLAKQSSIRLVTGVDLARMILEAGIHQLDKAL